MKEELFRYLKITSILLFSFIALALISYNLPQEKVYKNIKKTIEKYTQNKNQISPIVKKNSHKLDYFTEGIIINNILAVPDSNNFKSALLVPRYHKYKIDSPQISWNQVRYAFENQDKKPNHSYPRYWHGSTFLYRIFFLFTDYSTIITIILSLTSILLLSLFLKLHNNFKIDLIIAFTIALLFINVYLMQFLIQFSSVLMIALISSLILISRLNKNKTIIPLFFITGALTVYFDILTVPLLSLGLPLLIFVYAADNKDNFLKIFVNTLKISFTWLAGFAVFWIFKWLLVDIFTNYDIWTDVIGNIGKRAGSLEISRLDGLQKNFRHVNFPLFFIIITIQAILATLFFKKDSIHKIPVYIFISLIPLLRYMVLANHSYYHHWFTYRSLFIFFTAVFLSLFAITDTSKIAGFFSKKATNNKV